VRETEFAQDRAPEAGEEPGSPKATFLRVDRDAGRQASGQHGNRQGVEPVCRGGR
jgi:hypothetical protein